MAVGGAVQSVAASNLTSTSVTIVWGASFTTSSTQTTTAGRGRASIIFDGAPSVALESTPALTGGSTYYFNSQGTVNVSKSGLTPNTTYEVIIFVTDTSIPKTLASQAISFTTPVQLSYNSNGGSSTPGTQYFGAGSQASTASAPTRSGYTFDYWVGSNGTNYAANAFFTMPSTALTLTASWSVIYVPTPAPGAPTSLVISGETTSRVTLSWTAGSGTISNYGLYKDGVFVTTVTSSTLTYTYTGLSANTTYSLGVRSNGPDYSSSITTKNGTTLQNSFTVPNVVGQSQAVATNSLTTAGFGSVTPTLVTAGATSSNNLLVISQNPLSGTSALSGSTATINVYNYLAAIPNIIGLSETAAGTALINAGFTNKTLTTTTVGATVANNLTIISTNPTAGTQYNIASNVSYVMANFLTAVPNVVGLAQDTAISTLATSGFTNVNVTLTLVGVTPANAGTVSAQTPVNSATTYNPKNQAVSLTVYSLGITGKRYNGTGFSALATAKRFNGTSWVQLSVQKRFNGTSWIDIAN